MPLPFYVSPEQMVQDKAEYAKKGISKGRSSIALEFQNGILLLADNPSSLNKISEVYDRIAFAGAGKYSEFENLRKAGIRHADMKGYLYSREDVTAKSMANAYSQSLGTIFSQEVKPFEVDILVVAVGRGEEPNEMYRISFDGSIADEKKYAVVGGKADAIFTHLKGCYTCLPLKEAVGLAVKSMEEVYTQKMKVDGIEVAVLDKIRTHRTFRRISQKELSDFLTT